VRERCVEVVGQARAAGACGLVGRPEHELVDEQLRAPVEKLGQRLLSILGVEGVLLVDANPRHLLPLLRDLLVEPSQLLLACVYRRNRGFPFVPRPDLVLGHRRLL
jgi:hypothetical protein